jgi:U6 snRNA-associated Sm-like protein LSm1
VLQSTVERVFAPPADSVEPQSEAADEPIQPAKGLFADIPHGVFIVRGENVMLLGEIDLDKDDDPPPGYERADVALVQKLSAERREKEKERAKNKTRKLATLGFEGENLGENLL